MLNPLQRKLFVLGGLTVVVFGLASAQTTSEDRSVEPFSKIRAERGVDVVLTPSDRESLRIEAENFDPEDVRSEVRGDELFLSRAQSFTNGLLRRARVTAHVGVVRLSSIEATSGADVRSADVLRLDALTVRASSGSDVDLDVEAEQIALDLSGGSELELRGRSGSLEIKASGGSDVDAGSFEAERVSLELSGGSDAEVRANASVEINASGGSDVTVRGEPADRDVRADRSSDITWR